ncbi:MAG: hypothetical protein M0P12_01630 [Paludibacteraceae bacterium]|nr:hypothetical protein [Paludibacteraceae bacterium]
MRLKNLASRTYNPSTDDALREELSFAGIPPCDKYGDDFVLNLTENSEVKTKVIAFWNLWEFRRAWNYWVCTSKYGLPLEYALPLHLNFGKEVRVDGDCGCPSPETRMGFGITCYHIDSVEGLKAFADTLMKVVEDSKFPEIVKNAVGFYYKFVQVCDLPNQGLYKLIGSDMSIIGVLRNTVSGVRYLEKKGSNDILSAVEL